MNLFCCCILPTLKAEHHYIAPDFTNAEDTCGPAHHQVSSEPQD